TRDVLATGTATGEPRTASEPHSRGEAIETLVAPEFWQGLSQQMDVRVEAISTAAAGDASDAATGTDLHHPLAQLADQDANLRAVVLLSDGDWNEGAPPVHAAARLRLRGVPVFVLPVGSPVQLP